MLKEIFDGHENAIIDPIEIQRNVFLFKVIEVMVSMNCPTEILVDAVLLCD